MSFSLSNLVYQSPERDKENNRHREAVLRAKADRYKARAELVRARKGTPEQEDDDGGPPEVGHFSAQAAIDSSRGDDESPVQEWIEENPALTVVGAVGLGLGLAKLMKVL